MTNKYYPVARPYIDNKDLRAVRNVLLSGMLSLGPEFRKFEEGICKYTGARYACAVSSGTAGLHLAVKALELKEGDEVITSPFSFISSSNCLLYEGVKPVFADISEDTYNIDPAKIEKAVNSKTKAILVVHIFGQPANMDHIMQLAKKHNLKVIEDACESLGAKYENQMTGIIGDVGVYAFYPNKQMTTGEGGMLVSSSSRVYSLCDSLRNQGRNKEGDWLVHERMGYNYRMDEMSAALGVTQLAKIDWMINQKREIAGLYNRELGDLKEVITPQIGNNRTHSWFVYVIRITNGKRNRVMKLLSEKGIQTKPYLPVIHLQPFMVKEYGFKTGDYPIAEKISSETLALPFFIGLKKKDIEYIVNQIKNVLSV